MLRAETSRGDDAALLWTCRSGWALAGGVGQFFLILAALAGMENN
jgi:hypothetical protein